MNTLDTQCTYDYVIAGGGIGGIYSAWRLKNAATNGDEPKIAILESSGRIGGRLLSVVPPKIPSARVELGGMRYIEGIHAWISAIVDHLGLATEPLAAGLPENITYVRGRHLRMFELTDAEKLPMYGLRADEKTEHVLSNITAQAAFLALRPTIRDVLGIDLTTWEDLAKVTPDDWKKLADVGNYEGIPLYKLPMRYLFLQKMSHECLKLAQGASGYDSIWHTWNAADGFPWNVGDFGSEVKYLHVTSGYESLPLMLAKQLGPDVMHLNTRLAGFGQDGEGVLTLDVDQAGQATTIRAKNLVLAMPRRAIELLEQRGPVLDPKEEKVHELIESVTPIPLFKLAICYPSAWWEELPPVDTPNAKGVRITHGESTTDLPIRQCYYWKVDPQTKHAVILIYDDGVDLDYWAGLRDAKRDPFPHAPGAEIEEHFGLPHWKDFPAPAAMVAEVHRQLLELHGVDAANTPEPYAAAYQDWGDDPYGGGANFWPVGVKSYDVEDQIVHPKPSVPVYICGSCYSHQQGWAEGALVTAEKMLQGHLGLNKPAWKTKYEKEHPPKAGS